MSGTGDPTSASTPEELAQRVEKLELFAEELSIRLGLDPRGGGRKREPLAIAEDPGSGGRKPEPQSLDDVIELVRDLRQMEGFRSRG